MSKVLGIVKIEVDGVLQRSKKGATLNTGGVKREPVTGHAVYGHTEEVMAPTLEFVVAHMSDTDAIAMNELEDVTVTFEGDDGSRYTVQDCNCTDPCEVKDTGEMTVKMYGKKCVKE